MTVSVEQAIQIISDSTENSRLATAATVLLNHYLDLLIVAQSMMDMVDESEEDDDDTDDTNDTDTLHA